MEGRDFLDLGRELLAGATEPHWRGAVGRAYYALMLECREALIRWGFSLPPRDNVHAWVRLRLTYAADVDLRSIGLSLDKLGRRRNAADYDLAPLPAFQTGNLAQDSVQEAAQAITLLDAIERTPARRGTAIGAVRKAFP